MMSAISVHRINSQDQNDSAPEWVGSVPVSLPNTLLVATEVAVTAILFVYFSEVNVHLDVC